MKIKQIITWGLAGLLGCGTLTGGFYYLRSRIEDRNNIEAKAKFDTLKELADVDSDGKLSVLERILLIERLNAHTYYPKIKWTDTDLERKTNYGLGYSLNTIEGTIGDYKK